MYRGPTNSKINTKVYLMIFLIFFSFTSPLSPAAETYIWKQYLNHEAATRVPNIQRTLNT